MQSDPVPAITEAAASGETALIFADLRATLGVGVVNLVWRHIATFPGALPWAWATLEPVYVSGSVAMEALRLKAGLALPALPVWTDSMLRRAGIDAAGEASIRRILASYNRSNAMNLVALSALVRRIDRAPPDARTDPPSPDQPPEAAIEGALPKLLTLDEVTADTADLVRRINLLGDRDQGRILASMYRHLRRTPSRRRRLHPQRHRQDGARCRSADGGHFQAGVKRAAPAHSGRGVTPAAASASCTRHPSGTLQRGTLRDASGLGAKSGKKRQPAGCAARRHTGAGEPQDRRDSGAASSKSRNREISVS